MFAATTVTAAAPSGGQSLEEIVRDDGPPRTMPPVVLPTDRRPSPPIIAAAAAAAAGQGQSPEEIVDPHPPPPSFCAAVPAAIGAAAAPAAGQGQSLEKIIDHRPAARLHPAEPIGIAAGDAAQGQDRFVAKSVLDDDRLDRGPQTGAPAARQDGLLLDVQQVGGGGGGGPSRAADQIVMPDVHDTFIAAEAAPAAGPVGAAPAVPAYRHIIDVVSVAVGSRESGVAIVANHTLAQLDEEMESLIQQKMVIDSKITQNFMARVKMMEDNANQTDSEP
jgi:hypothetical protein